MVDIEKCPGCGAILVLSKDRRNMICEYCGSTYPVKNINGALASKDAVDAKIVSLYAEAEEYRQKEDYGLELNALASALELSPDNARTLVKLGRAYRTMNFFAKAEECYERAIEVDPQYGAAYCNLGAICLLSGENQKAVEYYEKGIELVDKRNASDYSTSLANYALAIGRSGDKRKAAALLDKAEGLGYRNGKAIRKELKISIFSRLFG